MPPLAVNVCWYVAPTSPLGTDDGVIVIVPATTVRGKDPGLLSLSVSVTVTCSVEFPVAVGVPLIVLPFTVSHAGAPVIVHE